MRLIETDRGVVVLKLVNGIYRGILIGGEG